MDFTSFPILSGRGKIPTPGSPDPGLHFNYLVCVSVCASAQGPGSALEAEMLYNEKMGL